MKKILSLFISIAILLVLLTFVPFSEVAGALRQARLDLIVLSLLLLVVLIVLSAFRLWLILPVGKDVGLFRVIAATFTGGTLNLVLPAKMGDIAKGTLIIGKAGLSSALTVVTYEKILDLFCCLALGVVAFYLLPDKTKTNYAEIFFISSLAAALFLLLVNERPARLIIRMSSFLPVKFHDRVTAILQAWLNQRAWLLARKRLFWISLGLTFLIWAGHFLQILLMAVALGMTTSLLTILTAIPIAILAGLIPFTFAGVGTRDAALVALIGPVHGFGAAAALGILFWLRYLIPGMLGLPFINQYVDSIRELVREKKLQGQ